MPKNIEPMKSANCVICFKKLTGDKMKYCSDNCKQQHRQLQTKGKELTKENLNLDLIYWNKKDNPNGELEWRTIKGKEHNVKKPIKNIVTKKKPKSKKKSGFSFN